MKPPSVVSPPSPVPGGSARGGGEGRPRGARGEEEAEEEEGLVGVVVVGMVLCGGMVRTAVVSRPPRKRF